MKRLPNKDLFFCDEKGNYSLLSTAEALSKRLNKWVGWKCSAGVNNLHITADGNIFAATCKVGGLLGNVFDHGVEFPKEWITCSKTWCMCGSDMRLLKMKDTEAITLGIPTHFQENIVNANLVGPDDLYEKHRAPQIITWDIGRRCNYSCSYCPPSTANNFESHKSLQSLKQAADLLLTKFCKDKNAKWVFTGGEPTINPAYLDLIKYLASFQQVLHTQSNGSRDPNYFSELIRFSSVGLSVHFEEYNEERLLENCKAIIKEKLSDPKVQKNWFSIRFMVAPLGFEQARLLKTKIQELSNSEMINAINMSPLYSRENGEELMRYSSEELALIEEHA